MYRELKLIALLFPLLILLSLYSCKKDDPEFSDNDTLPASNIIDTLTGLGHEESGDYTWDEKSIISINFVGNSISTGSANVTINGSTATITHA